MKCKQAEKLIIEWSQTGLDPLNKAKLDAHILSCPKCSSFSEHLYKIHRGINKMKAPEPSMKLLEKTSALCHRELMRQSRVFSFENSRQLTAKTPKLIWTALGASLVLIIVWAFPILKEFVNEQIITQRTIYVITIIIQNILMLFFAPVLLRSMKLKLHYVR